MSEHEKEEEGTLYECARVVVQARAIVAAVNAIFDSLPADARAAAMLGARQTLANDPGALKILNSNLAIAPDPARLKSA